MWNWVVDYWIVTLIVGCFGLAAVGGGAAPMARVGFFTLVAVFLIALIAVEGDVWIHRHRHP